MPKVKVPKTRHTFPRQWLADPKAREILTMFNKTLPKRPWVSVTDDRRLWIQNGYKEGKNILKLNCGKCNGSVMKGCLFLYSN